MWVMGRKMAYSYMQQNLISSSMRPREKGWIYLCEMMNPSEQKIKEKKQKRSFWKKSSEKLHEGSFRQLSNRK